MRDDLLDVLRFEPMRWPSETLSSRFSDRGLRRASFCQLNLGLSRRSSWRLEAQTEQCDLFLASFQHHFNRSLQMFLVAGMIDWKSGKTRSSSLAR